MKTKAILLGVALTIFGSTNLFASGEDHNAEAKVSKSYFNISKQFQSKLTSPFHLSQAMNPETVFIKFHVTNSFKVVIDDMVCNDNRLKSHIEKSLTDQVILIDKENVNKSYSIKMTFK